MHNTDLFCTAARSQAPYLLILKAPTTKIVTFANSADPDEVAHNEPPHLELHCFPLVFEFMMDI